MQFTLSCPVHSSYRVQQIAGMFDVAVNEKAERTLCFEMPPCADTDDNSHSWSIGCIVGPSGSGKSAIAKHLFAQYYDCGSSNNWDSDKAIIDNFGDLPIKTITSMLTVVGFSSPPSWIKPYSVLSNGEKFRCDLARALLKGGLVVFDEYTSVVDRNVAKIASAALAKCIRRQRETANDSAAVCGLQSAVTKLPRRFVAVTCHYDILDWLEPDWVLDTAIGKVSRRLLRRPPIDLEIFRCERSLWEMFKAHHYLSGDLAKSCRCYAALWKGNAAAFCALIPQQGFERWYRVSRLVTLPDYQGIGIGSAFLDVLAGLYAEQGFRFSITASHPSVLSHCKRSERWKAINVQKTGSARSKGRAVVSFVFREPDA